MHVGRHFAEGMEMISWWQERIAHQAQLPSEPKPVRDP